MQTFFDNNVLTAVLAVLFLFILFMAENNSVLLVKQVT